MAHDPHQPIIVHVDRVGGLGNQMFQHMAALFLISKLRHAQLSGIELGTWGLFQPDKRRSDDETFVVHRDTHMRMPIERILRAVERREIGCVNIRNYVQHMDNLLPPSAYRDVYVDKNPQCLVDDDELLINVRGNEILGGGAPDYVLIPVDYLKQIVAETGLKPVLMGQLTPGPYLDALREGLPNARLLASRGIAEDFSTIRNAKNIVISISTFSWLAAWLSNAERIFFPIAGLFHPFQREDIDLLPLEDPRYRFDLFPFYVALPANEAVAQHRAISGLWRRIGARQFRAMRASRPRIPYDFTQIARYFDEEYYLRKHWDVGGAKREGIVPSGFEHFLRTGRQENREPFELDLTWYCSQYPTACLEIGQGDYLNCHHHYAEVGELRGYRPLPP